MWAAEELDRVCGEVLDEKIQEDSGTLLPSRSLPIRPSTHTLLPYVILRCSSKCSWLPVGQMRCRSKPDHDWVAPDDYLSNISRPASPICYYEQPHWVVAHEGIELNSVALWNYAWANNHVALSVWSNAFCHSLGP